MSGYALPIQRLIKELSRFPGIGEKTAARLTNYILHVSAEDARRLAETILDVKDKIRLCSVCFNLADGELCNVCADPARNRGLICVVEEPDSLIALETSGGYRGVYHVLHGALSPLDGIGPEQLRIRELLDRVAAYPVEEVIVATNPSVPGETTALLISKLLKERSVKVTRIALGVHYPSDVVGGWLAGMAVVLPAGLAYRFFNPGDDNLELIMVVEEIPAGFVPNERMSVGDYRPTLPSVGMHWSHIGRGFTWDTPPKFANPMGFAAVSIDKFDIAQPHVHGPGCEEIWCQLQGTSLLLFGNRLLRQEPGEAFLVPPNKKVPHSSINPSDGPMLWLYMGTRRDQVR
jgi:recombination protein RecR